MISLSAAGFRIAPGSIRTAAASLITRSLWLLPWTNGSGWPRPGGWQGIGVVYLKSRSILERFGARETGRFNQQHIKGGIFEEMHGSSTTWGANFWFRMLAGGPSRPLTKMAVETSTRRRRFNKKTWMFFP